MWMVKKYLLIEFYDYFELTLGIRTFTVYGGYFLVSLIITVNVKKKKNNKIFKKFPTAIIYKNGERFFFKVHGT